MTLASPGTKRAAVGWSLCVCVVLAAILVPFLLFGEQLEAATQSFLEARPPDWQVALVLGGLLAGDIVLPVPSSLVGTASGALLGFWGGMTACWVGMMVGCGWGYLLGARGGEAALRRTLGPEELQRLSRLAERRGAWLLIALRGVPMLAESSVLFAGASRMPLGSFLGACALSNLGVCATYAAVGAYSARLGSFLTLFLGMVLLPGLALWLVRRFLPGRPATQTSPMD
ncbi:TVP38/TMEM64 family protein [Corallococcus exiguus]|uniref:TVP38/TMEM64 family protein n=1 Tax=Corallococcus exiguus TaxID=83462 RepID=UPI001471AA68|nr:VTT domain-containing protein [Corallococcus exiguus]NNB84378.1 VTT domain-containing protein [Corallococcus exiguus]